MVCLLVLGCFGDVVLQVCLEDVRGVGGAGVLSLLANCGLNTRGWVDISRVVQERGEC